MTLERDERGILTDKLGNRKRVTSRPGAACNVTGLLHIPVRTSKRALRLPEIRPRVSGKRG